MKATTHRRIFELAALLALAAAVVAPLVMMFTLWRR